MISKAATRYLVTSKISKRSFKWFALPLLAVLAVVILGSTYYSAQAYTIISFLPKITMTPTGFYNTRTAKPFVPRGANFVRLATSATGLTYHSTFEPGQYNPAHIQATLTGMKNAGYNTVRVFIDHGEFTTTSHGISSGIGSNQPIRAEYMANVVNFVTQAAAKGIYTIPVLDGVPANTYYYKTAGSPTGNIHGNNVLYLDPRYVQAKELYVKEFITALQTGIRNSNGVRGGVLAYATDNEVFFESNRPPFDTMSGTLTSLDGLKYDMAKTADRQQAMDANLVVYSARMKQAIASADPQGLLNLGFFTNNAVGKTSFNGAMPYCSTQCSATTNYRVPGRPAAVSIYGKADFIDLHAYSSGVNYSPKADLASSEYTLFKKPYIIGEFGTEKKSYSSVTNAAIGMKNMQIASCSLNAKGWLFWTWDTSLTTSLASQNLFYSLADNNGAINGQLAPIVRPDPCR
jgi:endo-1,4-beta-mannosidase